MLRLGNWGKFVRASREGSTEQPSRDFFTPTVAGGGGGARRTELFLIVLAALAVGWWWGAGFTTEFGSKWTELTARLKQVTSEAQQEIPKPQMASVAPSIPVARIAAEPVKPRIVRRSTLKAFMKEELKLSPSQLRKYEQYRRYYTDHMRGGADVAKLTIERERLLVGLAGQRNLDSIRWWALGAKPRISLNEWLRKAEAERQRNAPRRGIASR